MGSKYLLYQHWLVHFSLRPEMWHVMCLCTVQWNNKTVFKILSNYCLHLIAVLSHIFSHRNDSVSETDARWMWVKHTMIHCDAVLSDFFIIILLAKEQNERCITLAIYPIYSNHYIATHEFSSQTQKNHNRSDIRHWISTMTPKNKKRSETNKCE